MLSCLKKWPLFLALVLMVSAILFRYWGAPQLLSLPTDFYYTADLNSVDNFYDEALKDFSGQQYSTAQFGYEVSGYNAEGYLIENFFHVSNLDGEPIVSIVREYGIDPIHKTHLSSLGDRPREGYLFAPKHLNEGEAFVYWHVNYDAPALMSYVETTELYGLEVFHYESTYTNEVVDQTENLDSLPGVPEERGVVLDPHLELWVEPLTGHLVQYKDETVAYFYDQKTLARIHPWNAFSNTFTDASVQAHVLDAKLLKTKTILFETIFPLLIFGIGLFLFVYCFWHQRHVAKGNNSLHWIIPLFIVLTPLAMLSGAWMVLRSSMMKELETRFEEHVANIEDALLRRLEIYANSLEGATGLFAASEEVSREEWKTYVETLELNERYPGVLGVGYVKLVPQEEKMAHIDSVRAEGFEDYTIHPEGDRPLYSTILYLEPFEGDNLLAFGYDMLTEDVRQEAMDLARDSGGITVSGKVHLIQDADNPNGTGFLMYLPLYATEMTGETVAERRQNIYGYVYSPFRVSELMDGLFQNTDLGMHFDLYDGLNTDLNQLIFRYEEQENPEVTFTKVNTLYVLGHPWTLEFFALESYGLNSDQKLLLYGTLILGGISSFLFIFLFLALLVSRQRLIDYIRRKKRFMPL